MRLALRSDRKNILPCAALIAASGLTALPASGAGQAETAMLAQSADPAAPGHCAFTGAPTAPTTSENAMADASADGSQLTGYALTMPANAASMKTIFRSTTRCSRGNAAARPAC